MTAVQINQSMTLRQWGALFALSVLWGGSFFFIGVAVKELPPLTMVTMRLIIASLALYAVMRATGVKMPRGVRTWLAFAWLGLINNVVPFSLFAWGQTHITGGLASIINATTPLFTVLVAHLLTRDERMTIGHVLGAMIGLAGVAAMIGADTGSFFTDSVLAQLACLFASICYAFAGVYGRRFAGMGIPPLAAATAQLTASSFLILPVMLLVDQPWALPAPSAAALAAIVGQSLFSTALAFVVFFHLLATAGATNVALVAFLNPVTAMVLGTAFLGERIAAAQLIGMAIIGIGLALIDGRPVRAIALAVRAP